MFQSSVASTRAEKFWGSPDQTNQSTKLPSPLPPRVTLIDRKQSLASQTTRVTIAIADRIGRPHRTSVRRGERGNPRVRRGELTRLSSFFRCSLRKASVGFITLPPLVVFILPTSSSSPSPSGNGRRRRRRRGAHTRAERREGRGGVRRGIRRDGVSCCGCATRRSDWTRLIKAQSNRLFLCLPGRVNPPGPAQPSPPKSSVIH
jgi:hypothetical protein